jgi:hypothetical protein
MIFDIWNPFIYMFKSKLKLFLSLLLLSFLVLPIAGFAAENDVESLKNVYIKYQRTGWQTYDFYAITNLENVDSLQYEWTINETESFASPHLKYFLDQGDHRIRLRVEDQYGVTKYDNVKIIVSFWSLQNNWFWWFVYLFVVLIILYYWTAKLIYLLNERKMNEHTRQFFAFLDEHGWVEKVIAHHSKN